MRVRVEHSIGDLSKDMAGIPPKAMRDMVRVVKRNTTRGHKLAQRLAQKSSGIHGANYYKRITDEMLSPLEGEYGPEGDVVENAVGAGWRKGPSNTDLPKSADVVGPAFAKEVGNLPQRWFW